MKVGGIIAMIMICSLMGIGQDVQVSQGNGSVVLSVFAVKPYQLMSGEEKTPVLSLSCAQKGKKSVHILEFQPGTSLPEDEASLTLKGEHHLLKMTIGGTKEETTWVPYGDTVTFAYFGKTEPERVRFIQTLLSSRMVSIEFQPFLTGTATTSVFDITRLQEEASKHPECTMR